MTKILAEKFPKNEKLKLDSTSLGIATKKDTLTHSYAHLVILKDTTG